MVVVSMVAVVVVEAVVMEPATMMMMAGMVATAMVDIIAVVLEVDNVFMCLLLHYVIHTEFLHNDFVSWFDIEVFLHPVFCIIVCSMSLSMILCAICPTACRGFRTGGAGGPLGW